MKLATLLYIKDTEGNFLLMKRLKEPNKGLMSPPGGKLDTDNAESPAACAVRESFEECGIRSGEQDWIIRGIVTEKDFPKAGNIMIFLMEYKKFLNQIPEPCSEGEFHFIGVKNLYEHKLPVTDRLFIWEKILDENKDFIMLTIDCADYPDIKVRKNLKF